MDRQVVDKDSQLIHNIDLIIQEVTTTYELDRIASTQAENAAHKSLLQKIDMQLNTVYSDYIYFSAAKRDIFTTNNNHLIYHS